MLVESEEACQFDTKMANDQMCVIDLIFPAAHAADLESLPMLESVSVTIKKKKKKNPPYQSVAVHRLSLLFSVQYLRNSSS
jgi:hypothetical protein